MALLATQCLLGRLNCTSARVNEPLRPPPVHHRTLACHPLPLVSLQNLERGDGIDSRGATGDVNRWIFVDVDVVVATSGEYHAICRISSHFHRTFQACLGAGEAVRYIWETKVAEAQERESEMLRVQELRRWEDRLARKQEQGYDEMDIDKIQARIQELKAK